MRSALTLRELLLKTLRVAKMFHRHLEYVRLLQLRLTRLKHSHSHNVQPRAFRLSTYANTCWLYAEVFGDHPKKFSVKIPDVSAFV